MSSLKTVVLQIVFSVSLIFLSSGAEVSTPFPLEQFQPRSHFEIITGNGSTTVVDKVIHPSPIRNDSGHTVIISSHQSVPKTHSIIVSPHSPSSSVAILTQPLRTLVLRSFEGYRRLMRDAYRVEDSIRQTFGLPKRTRLQSLDPLLLPDPVVLEHRDKNVPVLGKVVVTMTDVLITGLSNFRVEELNGFGRSLSFQHVMPHLDTVANYTMDYHLFDAIPLRVSAGQLTARIPNARVRGSFQIFPDILKAWFRVAQMNLTTWVEDLDLRFHPTFLVSDRFAIDRSTVDKIHTAFNHFLPNVTDLLRLTYTKAIEMRMM